MTATPLVDVCRALYPLHRTLVSDGTDTALEIIGQLLPPAARYTVERYVPGTPVWTWRVPERFVVHEAVVTYADDGQVICDAKDSPLHVVSYSLPVDRVLDWEALAPHVVIGPEAQPDAIPWMFKYYERGWGVCLSFRQAQALDRTRLFRVRLRTEFPTGRDDGLAVGVATLCGASPRPREFLLCANVCHPYQVNDSITGVALAVGLARRLERDPLPAGSATVRFLFCPETIGSICYLAHHPELRAPQVLGACFADMLGTPGPLVLQRTRCDADRLNRIARVVLAAHGHEGREWGFRESGACMNDEIVLNGPGVDIPTVSLSRYPYPEYHLSTDTPNILDEAQILAVLDVVEGIVRIAATDYVPRRTFTGPLFLSGHGLWVDWRTHPHLNAAVEQLMLRLEGELSVFDISQAIGLSYPETHAYLERLAAGGFITREEV